MHGPSSTLNSNVLEMTHYAFAHLNRGEYNGKRILSDSIYNRWWTNTINMKDKASIGFAWWLSERNGTKLVTHSGGDTGFRSMFMLVPEKNIGIMLVGNYELIRSFDLAAALLDIMMDIEPKPVRRQIGFAFGEIMKSEGIDAARAFFTKTQADSVQRALYLWDENDAALAYPGYLFMQQQQYDDAIAMFKFNLEQFPKSAWAHSHLATGYAEAGDKESARQNFRKAIQLDPQEQSFKDDLANLSK
ncbi:MAG TPA: serine hydrolase, partial [Chryseosolibacter sp.]